MRSRTGCLTCRQRKLKCDEQRPRCGQCSKANRECELSTGIVFRHHHNASMNAPSDAAQAGGSSTSTGTLNGFYAYRNTFDEDSVWLDIPKQITFVNTTNPYDDDLHYLANPYQGNEQIPHFSQQQHEWSGTGLDHRGDTANGLEALSAAALRMPNNAVNASEDLADFTSLQSIRDLGSHEEAAPAAVNSDPALTSGNDINSNLPSQPEHIASAIDPALEISYPATHASADASESSSKKLRKGPT